MLFLVQGTVTVYCGLKSVTKDVIRLVEAEDKLSAGAKFEQHLPNIYRYDDQMVCDYEVSEVIK